MLIPKDAYGRIIDPGDIVLHTRKGRPSQQLLVHSVQVRRVESYGGSIINKQQIQCFPLDQVSRWSPITIRVPANLVITQKRSMD